MYLIELAWSWCDLCCHFPINAKTPWIISLLQTIYLTLSLSASLSFLAWDLFSFKCVKGCVMWCVLWSLAGRMLKWCLDTARKPTWIINMMECNPTSPPLGCLSSPLFECLKECKKAGDSKESLEHIPFPMSWTVPHEHRYEHSYPAYLHVCKRGLQCRFY